METSLAAVSEGASCDVVSAEFARGGAGANVDKDSSASQLVLIESMVLEIKELRRNQEKLQKEVNFLRAEARNESISFAGHHFYSEESFLSFVQEHVRSGYYGFCFDLVSVLECFPDWNRSSDAGIATRALILEAGYSDTYQARIDTSFLCVIPKVFGDKVDDSKTETNFVNLKSINDWYTLQKNVNDFITNFKRIVVKQIQHKFKETSTAGLFFESLIAHTVKFWEKYSAWLFQFERMLCFDCCGKDPQTHKASVWKLISCLTHSMFLEMSVQRIPGTFVARTSDESVKCASILHGTLGAHKFMEELMEAEFVQHPIFAAKIMEYLLLSRASSACRS